MFKLLHIRMANLILENLCKRSDKNLKGLNINKIAYCLGSVIPDINCIYPAHRLNTTYLRVIKRINNIDKTKNIVRRSFNLGIVTHYVCDYFCFAHANESVGVSHITYEIGIDKYFKTNRELFKNNYSLKDEWNNTLDKITSNIKNDKITLNIEEHAKLILEQIKDINSKYIENSNGLKIYNWTNNKDQWHRDLKYAIFVCEMLLTNLLNVENFGVVCT